MTWATAFLYNLSSSSSSSSDGEKKDHRVIPSSRKIRAYDLTIAINHGGGNGAPSQHSGNAFALEVSWDTGLVGLFLGF